MLISVAVLYVAHRNFPFAMDDHWYRTNLVTGGPVSSFSDIVESQVWHYVNWGGRSVGHGILQLTLWAGENAADILNVLVTLLLAFAVSRTAGGRGIWTLFLTLAMILGLTAGWKTGMLWQSGAANYLYMSVFVFGYLHCYFRAARGKKELPLAAVWMVPLGLAAGWSNENIGPAVWVLSLIVLIWQTKEKKKAPLYMVTGNLACLLGSVAVIAAPGNFVRSAYAEEGYGLLWRIFLRCYALSRGLLEYLFPALLVAGFVCIIGKCMLRIDLGRERALLLLGALLSWGALILSPVTVDRAYFGTTLFLIAFSVSYIKDAVRERPGLLWPFMAAGSAIWLRGMYLLGEYVCTCWGWIK